MAAHAGPQGRGRGLARSLDEQERGAEQARADDGCPVVILRGCGPSDLIWAAAAASWALTDMPGKGAVVVQAGRKFGLQRNEASLTVWLERKEATA